MSQSGPAPVHALPGTIGETPSQRAHLLGGECLACGAKVFPRPKICSVCWSEDVRSVPLASRGRLYSCSVVHVARKGWRAPYAIAYVDLEDGVRVCAPLEVEVANLPPLDSEVELVVGLLRTEADGRAVLSHRFAPVGGAA
jgi:uncharacterized OB-fold protein